MFVLKSKYEALLNCYTEETAHVAILEDVLEGMKKYVADLETQNKNMWKLLHPKIKGQQRDSLGRFTKKERK